jgi:hypothetical protein
MLRRRYPSRLLLIFCLALACIVCLAPLLVDDDEGPDALLTPVLVDTPTKDDAGIAPPAGEVSHSSGRVPLDARLSHGLLAASPGGLCLLA